MSMDNAITAQVQSDSLLEHPAVVAWQRISGVSFVPTRIETLKFKKKSAVYRLPGAGPAGATIIAKRCPVATGFIERLVYQEVLGRLRSPSLHCLEGAAEPESEFCWLFLEDAGGVSYSPHCAEYRVLAARCLALTQRAARAANAQSWLPEHGPAYYLRLLGSAR